MSGWTELRDLGMVFRPFDGTPPPLAHHTAPFSASWASTVELLADELRHLEADQVVVELALRDRDIRVDGMPRADARLEHDAARISFGSKWGPLVYETGEYDGVPWRRIPGWQCNLRAIALSMEALRKVDRYGVSKRGEQYRGWRAIPMSTGDPADAIQTEEQAWAVIADAAGVPRDSSALANGVGRQEAVKRAVLATHPDRGGDEVEFRKVIRARELLG